MTVSGLAVREAALEDAPRLAELAGQLGYLATADELRQRLASLPSGEQAVVLVAAGEEDVALGWVHVALRHDLVTRLTAQVMGLVVDEAARSRGIGARLLDAAERWAAQRGCARVLIGTRVTRQRAHGFYRRRGYALLKTSHFFEKGLR